MGQKRRGTLRMTSKRKISLSRRKRRQARMRSRRAFLDKIKALANIFKKDQIKMLLDIFRKG